MRTSTALRGFTLIEVLIIAPIIILFIGAFISLVVNLTGDSLRLQETNTAAYNVQDALDNIEANATQSLGFLTTTNAVQSPQGEDNATAAFLSTDANTLITNSAATTKGPYDSTRSIIYTGTGSCNANNPVYAYKTVFFVSGGALYKRTILPALAACASPWQRGSCQDSLVSGSPTVCKASDEKLLDNVSALQITYYADGASSTVIDPSLANTATSISVDITYTKQVAGTSVTYTGSSRINSINTQDTSVQVLPTLPAIATSNSPTSGDQDNPYTSTFTWSSVGSATGYILKYRVNSGSWTTVNLSSGTTSYSVNTDSRKDPVDVDLTVQSQAGNYSYGTASVTNPRWQDCTLLNNWVNYASGYATAGYTRTSAGVIGLRGLMKSGKIDTIDGAGTGIACVLPVGFRPAQNLIFQVAGIEGGASGSARVDIYTNGNVEVQDGEIGWVSLSGITFLANNAPTSIAWTSATLANSWINYTSTCTTGGAGWGCLKYAKDTLGRVFVEGLLKPGTQTSGTAVTNSFSASGIAPSHTMHLTSRAASESAINITPAGSIAVRGVPASTTYQSFEFDYYPATFGGWVALPTINGWVAYSSATYSPPQCYKGADDLVMVRGLIKSGTAAAVTSNLNTVGCGIHSDGQLIMPAWMAANNVARVDVAANGTITFSTPYSTTWTSIDNIRFIAD